jgi:hypothetical protein
MAKCKLAMSSGLPLLRPQLTIASSLDLSLPHRHGIMQTAALPLGFPMIIQQSYCTKSLQETPGQSLSWWYQILPLVSSLSIGRETESGLHLARVCA